MNQIWWEGAGYYAPRQEGQFEAVTRWYRVTDTEDARSSGLGTPQWFASPDGMQILPF